MHYHLERYGNNDMEKIGQKIYKYIGGILVLCRLVRVKNDDCFIVETTDGDRINLTKSVYESYTKLHENGIVIISEVILDNDIPDIMISFFRNVDLSKGMPYAICRHNVYDYFSNTIENDNKAMYIACSVSQDTCPPNVDFRMMLGCNGCTRSDLIAVYYDDDIDDILRLIKGSNNMKYYDAAMKTLYDGFIKDKVRGTCSSVEQLLKENHFIEDIHRGLNVLKVNFTYEGNEKFLPEFIRSIEDIIKVEMIAPVFVKYNYDVDINKIQDKHLLILDQSKTLYVVSYKEGEYVNRPYYEMGDTTEIDTLKSLAQLK